MDRFKDKKSIALYMLALRYDSKGNEETDNKINSYLKSISNELVITKEIAKKTKKVHFHIYLTTNWLIKIDSQIKKIRRELQGYSLAKSDYYIKKCKDYDKYMIYILKDGDVIYSSINEDQLTSFKNQTMEINEDKKLPLYKKLYNRWIEYEGNLSLYAFIANTLIIEFDTFCRRQQIVEYAAYIKIKQSDGKKTEKILNDEFGLMDWQQFNQEKMNAHYKEYLDNKEFLNSDDES